jgi:low affinity Fe/Cu permease
MRHFLTRLGVYSASPVAFLVLIGYAVLWYAFSPETFEWHAVATLATWGMTLVIQRAEHGDTQAIHGKLDEILHALGDARDELTRLDEEEPEEIEKRRSRMRKRRLASASSADRTAPAPAHITMDGSRCHQIAGS